MKAEYERKFGEEDDLQWIGRLHKLATAGNSLAEADPEVVAIVVNQVPTLLSELEGHRKPKVGPPQQNP